jgi:hypothetical protein
MVVYIFVHIKWFRNILLQLSCISTYHVTVSRINILTCFDPWQVPQTIWPLPEHCTHLKYNSIDILLLCVERIKWAQDVTPTSYILLKKIIVFTLFFMWNSNSHFFWHVFTMKNSPKTILVKKSCRFPDISRQLIIWFVWPLP